MSNETPTPNSPVLTTIREIGRYVGQSVTLRGWLYNLRASGKLLFPIFRDGSGTIQGIVPKAAVPEQLFETIKNLTLESSVIVTGKVAAHPKDPSTFELQVEDLTVTHRIADDTPYPIQLKEAGVDFLMEHRHLWLRTPRQSAILRVRATIMRAAAEYFDTNGYIRTDPPILTPNACEGTSELFEMDYFDQDKAYLTQSGQLYIEATALALGKVYSFGPTFRAEKSKTRRHLTEFWMIEPEACYMDLDGLMNLAEGFLTHIVTRVLATHRDDLKVIGKDVTKLEAVIAPTPEACHPERSAAESKDPDDLGVTTTAKDLSTTNLSSRPEAEGRSGETPVFVTSPSEACHPERSAAESKDPEGAGITTTAKDLSTTTSHFPRLTYDEAHQMLLDAHAKGLLEHPHTYGDDFGSPDETYISSQFDKPVMIHRYPAAVKAFYMQPDPADPTKALCVDVLAPEGYGEIIGGSQRVDSYDLLKQRIEDHNLPMAAFQWYLDLRKYGSVSHSGFGMGIERCVAWICGLEHVRETIPFARTLNRIYP